MTTPTTSDSKWRRPILAAILLLAVALGSRGITDESSVMLGGDMARYMMDGVFVRDLAAQGGAWNFGDLTTYAEHYYARYPALSLGHHPPLPYFTLAGFYAVFGVSSFSARLANLSWFVLAVWALYLVTKQLAGWRAASWATVLFITNLYVLRFGQYVLSEMPMVALVLVSLLALVKYCETRRPMHFAWFVLAVVGSLFAKQLAVFMLPVYAVLMVSRLGWRGLIDRRVLLIGAVGVLVASPLVIMTIGLAPANVSMVLRKATRVATGSKGISIGHALTTIITSHLTPPAMVVTLAGAVALAIRRNPLGVMGLVWILTCLAGSVVSTGGIEPARYAFGALPAYFMLASGLASEARTTTLRIAATIALGLVVVWQGWIIRDVRPTGAGGYEAAAQYVLAQSAAPVVLYDSFVDTGYFVFFVRKHDPAGRLVTLRADKVLAPESERLTQLNGPDKSRDADSFYAALKLYGVRLVVVEERHTGPPVLRTMHEELRTDRFIERQRIPIASKNDEIIGSDLVVYEFKDAQPADPNAQVFIGLPLGNREIKLPLRDLIGAGGR